MLTAMPSVFARYVPRWYAAYPVYGLTTSSPSSFCSVSVFAAKSWQISYPSPTHVFVSGFAVYPVGQSVRQTEESGDS
jgi:hypothetical protein